MRTGRECEDDRGYTTTSRLNLADTDNLTSRTQLQMLLSNFAVSCLIVFFVVHRGSKSQFQRPPLFKHRNKNYYPSFPVCLRFRDHLHRSLYPHPHPSDSITAKSQHTASRRFVPGTPNILLTSLTSTARCGVFLDADDRSRSRSIQAGGIERSVGPGPCA